jgi:molybdopterin-guanine dinucleotide biosynthesis protein MobB
MRRIHVIGGKNHGKTSLMTELVQALSFSGFRVGTIKHTRHQHELDVPGKDSHRHRVAGASVAGILSRTSSAVFWDVAAPVGEDSKRGRYEQFEPYFSTCDVVLVEGDVEATAPKIEVWRAAAGGQPYAAADRTVLAVVSDDAPAVACPVWRRDDVAGVAERVLQVLSMGQA